MRARAPKCTPDHQNGHARALGWPIGLVNRNGQFEPMANCPLTLDKNIVFSQLSIQTIKQTQNKALEGSLDSKSPKNLVTQPISHCVMDNEKKSGKNSFSSSIICSSLQPKMDWKILEHNRSITLQGTPVVRRVHRTINVTFGGEW